MHQVRLADTWLASNERDLAMTGPGRPPARQKRIELLPAPDEVLRAAANARGETAFVPQFAKHPPDTNRVRYAFEFVQPEVVVFEKIAEQCTSFIADQ